MAAPTVSPTVVPWWSQFPARAALSALRYVPRVPLTTLEELFPGIEDQEINLRHAGRDRALWHGEAYVLSLITAFAAPRRILEIGTASGQGTALMAAQAPEARIDTLDLGNDTPSLGEQRGQPPWQDLSSIGAAYRDAGFGDRVTQHFGDSATFDYAPLAGQVDLAFVDGAHTYEYVKEDSANVFGCMRSGGVVVWDDCDYRSPGVSRALVELRKQGHQIHRIVGVRLAMLRVP